MAHYEVKYRNPNNVIVLCEQTLTTTRKTEVRELVQRSRQYPGSLEILEVVKVSKNGTVRVPMPWWTL